MRTKSALRRSSRRHLNEQAPKQQNPSRANLRASKEDMKGLTGKSANVECVKEYQGHNLKQINCKDTRSSIWVSMLSSDVSNILHTYGAQNRALQHLNVNWQRRCKSEMQVTNWDIFTKATTTYDRWHTVPLMQEILHQFIGTVVYPTVHRVLYIPRGARFFHQRGWELCIRRKGKVNVRRYQTNQAKCMDVNFNAANLIQLKTHHTPWQMISIYPQKKIHVYSVCIIHIYNIYIEDQIILNQWLIQSHISDQTKQQPITA